MRHGDLQWYGQHGGRGAPVRQRACALRVCPALIPVKLVEVKSGETFNGTLSNCDIWMNLHLVDVVQTLAVRDALGFHRRSDCGGG